MDPHPTRVKPKIRSQLVGPGGTSDARQTREQPGTSGLSQSVTGTIGSYGNHARSFSQTSSIKLPDAIFLVQLVIIARTREIVLWRT